MATNPPASTSPATSTRAWRGAEIPAAGGTGNARSVAEIHAILANGGVAKGKRFMSEAGCRKALELQIEGTDLILGRAGPLRPGLRPAGGVPACPTPTRMFWGGYGGSLAIIDMDARTTFAYAMNKMAGGVATCAGWASPWSRGRRWGSCSGRGERCRVDRRTRSGAATTAPDEPLRRRAGGPGSGSP